MLHRCILALCLLITTSNALVYNIRGAPRCYYGERGSLTATCENATSSFFRATGYRFDNLDETVRCLHCNLDAIAPNAFDISGNHILYLVLEDSNITSVAASSFVGLVYMETLSLAHNSIKTIVPSTFKGIKKLDTLNVGYNKITMLIGTAFAELGNLTKLYLNDNEIKSVDNSAFDKLTSLRELYLQNNMIADFENATSGLKSIKIINLENNNLAILRPEDINSTTLLELNLSRNKLKSLEPGMIYASQLAELDISQNEIETIKGGAFKGCKMLENINLEANKIKDVDRTAFIRLYHLRYINLARNNLVTLQTFVFTPLPELRYLNVSQNQIKSIQRSGVLPMHSLHSLDISHNNLTYLDYKLLIEHAPRLVLINIENNSLPCYLVEEMMQFFEEDHLEFSIDDKYGGINKTCNATATKEDKDKDYELETPDEASKASKLVTIETDKSSPNVYVIYSLIFILIGLVVVLFFLQYKTYVQMKYGNPGDIAEVGLMSSRGLESRENEY